MTTSHKAAFGRLFEDVGTVDQVGIEERVAKFQTRSIKKSSKLWGLKTAVSMVDLTTLEGKGHARQGRLALREGAQAER